MKNVAILGATGYVGQRFIQLLENHPWFKVTAVAASERSAGKSYAEACHWLLETPMPDAVFGLRVADCTPASVGDVDLVFSCLPGNLAAEAEKAFAQASVPVVSKASAHRMDADVPLIIPEVNPEHLALIDVQKKNRNWQGFISTDPNCSTAPLAITLKPLMDLGIRRVH
ncbi:MAG: aspartate-semialdehyde dehydrogenase, partial [Candidatus Micrarchaeota archaeon]|nr:aspartate-semialdehyde dehydrogenase [Candidatus Micrarchaeota archaeon]